MPTAIGEMVLRARKRRALSQEKLAEQLQLTHVQVSRIETGARLPSHGTLVALATFLDLDLNQLKTQADEA